MTTGQHMENAYTKYWIEDDIIFIVYKDNVSFDQPTAEAILGEIRAYLGNKRYPCLVDVSGIVAIDRPARVYMAREITHLFSRIAVVTKSFISLAIAKFFLAVNRPSIPINIFRDHELARRYLLAGPKD